MRSAAVLLLLFTLAAPLHAQTAGPANDKAAARCAELGSLYDRYAGRRGEGSGGPDLERVGAALDCQNGRYDRGIRTLEGLLRRNAIALPPA